MRTPLLTYTFLLLSFCARAQLRDDFADSNFTAAPAWTGTPGAWTVTAARQLQSTHPVINSSFYLSTPSTLATDASWEWWMRLAFATSSANYSDVWIISANADPSAAGNTGYFVRIGGTQDEVSLYRKDAGTSVKIIDGADGITAGSDNQLRIRVIRTGGVFRLQRSGSAGVWITEGTSSDNTYAATAHFALQVRQSTSGFLAKHFFDDIIVQPFVPDTSAPRIVSVRARNDSSLELRFNEPVDRSDAAMIQNFELVGGGAPAAAAPDASDASLIRLRFAQPFAPGTMLLLTVRNIRDEWGNLLLRDTGGFLWYRAKAGDVVIHELMADPDPPQGLPDVEWIELRNVSGKTIGLQGWTISNSTSTSAPLPDIDLAPDSLLIVSQASAAAALMPYGRVASLTGFPSLDNDGAMLVLKSAEGKTIHTLAYDRSWYRDAVKNGGGWSLEMIDDARPCIGGANWKASEDGSGGTPGRSNSVRGTVEDSEGPRLVRTWCPDSLHVLAFFSEPLDSLVAAAASFVITGGPPVVSAIPQAPLFDRVLLTLAAPLQRRKLYELEANDVRDCSGNEVGMNTAPVGIAEEVAPSKLVVNEILYAPGTGGAEWVELYFYGDGPADISALYIAGRNALGQASGAKRLTASPYLLFPGQYIVLTADPSDVRQRFNVVHPDYLIQLNGMPALSDDGASIVLLTAQGSVIDEVRYDPSWHHPLIRDPRGVSLERLQAAGPSQDPHNWHSAAESAGYSTPTARNSQQRSGEDDGELFVQPKLFSPDGDGVDDVAFISYETDANGYTASITIYDAEGRLCRRLVQNSLMGRKGFWHWDGTDDKGAPARPGIYVLHAEWLHPDGNRKTFKRTVALARRR